MIELVTLTEDLARQFEFTGDQGQTVGQVPVKEMLPKLLSAGPALAAIEKTTKGQFNIVAVGGAAMLWSGVYESWLLLNPEGERYIKTLVRGIWFLFRKIFEAGGHRIQTTVRCDNEKEIRWVDFLGFVWESRMPMYGPDREDHHRYVILKEDKKDA